MENYPSGIVTFLFTDIEGSTKLAQNFPNKFNVFSEKHNAVLSKAIESNNGIVFEIVGDAFCASFKDPYDAVLAAHEIQKTLSKEKWDEVFIKVRIGIHTGKAEWNGLRYTGYITLARTHRIMSAASGGQILVSNESFSVINKNNKPLISFRDLGERRLKDLIQPMRIYQIDSAELPSVFPPIKTLDARPNNLPVMLTHFIGRKKEIEEIKNLLSDTHLLTLTGPGGTGKTRLSLQVGGDVIDDFANGVWFVELAAIKDSTNILDEIAGVLRITSDNKKLSDDYVINKLKEKELLLILDNCEHLIDECSLIAAKFLKSCKKLKIIATSREPLQISGETSFRVPALTLPDLNEEINLDSISQFEAVKLFIDRSLSVNPGFKVTNSNAPHVAELCYRLDGIPLAIELAAARIRMLTVEQILEKINDRFRLLVSGNKSALPRQQTLLALIDWSYDLLSEEEKLLFQRLSVFSGGWTIESAEEICSDNMLDKNNIFELMSNLNDKSLIITQEKFGINRYNLLETIRLYGQEKLSAKIEFQKKHIQYYLKFCRENSIESIDNKINRYHYLKMEKENFRTAINWGIQSNPELALMLANEMNYVWDLDGNLSEGLETFKIIFDLNREFNEDLKADALMNAGSLAGQLGEYETAHEYLYKSLAIFRKINKKAELGFCLNHVGSFHFMKDEMSTAQKFHEEGLEIGREIDDNSLIALSLVNLASIFQFFNEFEKSCKLFEESLIIFRELGEGLSVARVLIQLGNIYTGRRELQKAKDYYDESIPVLKEYDDYYPIAISILKSGDVSFSQGKFEEARKLFEESLSLATEFGFTHLQIHSLRKLGNVELTKMNFSKAKELFLQSIELCDREADKHKLALAFAGLRKYYYDKKEFEKSVKVYGIAANLYESLGLNIQSISGESNSINTVQLKNSIGEGIYNLNFKEGKNMNLNASIEFILNDKS